MYGKAGQLKKMNDFWHLNAVAYHQVAKSSVIIACLGKRGLPVLIRAARCPRRITSSNSARRLRGNLRVSAHFRDTLGIAKS
jgi:hypothetical protein